jgi:geranylgeranyl pyrophosphate synthase
MAHDHTIDRQLAGVRQVVLKSLGRNAIGRQADVPPGWIAGGKMLRSRLVLRVGAAAGVPEAVRLDAAAAVEMLHAASLLHDDVIDDGRIRRGETAFWVENGMKSAILLGDLIVCRAFLLVQERNDDALLREFIRVSVEMCEAEAEQELHLQDAAPDWDTCVSLARRKTGSLFAFAGFGGAGSDPRLRLALREAGYTIGTLYQLADDILDVYGDPVLAGKTLGSDAAGAKVTAAAALRSADIDLRAYVAQALQAAEKSLADWPAVRAAWRAYVAEDIGPVIRTCLERLPCEVLS